jgi:hypothetical protein
MSEKPYATASISEIAALLGAGYRPIGTMPVAGLGSYGKKRTAALFSAEAKAVVEKFNEARTEARRVLGIGPVARG